MLDVRMTTRNPSTYQSNIIFLKGTFHTRIIRCPIEQQLSEHTTLMTFTSVPRLTNNQPNNNIHHTPITQHFYEETKTSGKADTQVGKDYGIALNGCLLTSLINTFWLGEWEAWVCLCVCVCVLVVGGKEG